MSVREYTWQACLTPTCLHACERFARGVVRLPHNNSSDSSPEDETTKSTAVAAVPVDVSTAVAAVPVDVSAKGYSCVESNMCVHGGGHNLCELRTGSSPDLGGDIDNLSTNLM